jgi:predicted PurR-regulated permease PerM
MFVASAPSVLLAWAESDLGRALVVIVALTVVNAAAENLVQPALMRRGLHLSPMFVILSVFVWSSLLGGGSFLAMPLSLALLTILPNYPAPRWFVAAVLTRNDEPTAERAAAMCTEPLVELPACGGHFASRRETAWLE